MKKNTFHVIASSSNCEKLRALGYTTINNKKMTTFRFKYFSIVGNEYFNNNMPYGPRYEIIDDKFVPAVFPNPKIVCLCGSTKYPELFKEAERTEALKGNITLTVAMFGHVEGLDMDSADKQLFDILHMRKIELADEIFVLTKDKRIGESTANEIAYAKSLNKLIRYLEDIE